MQNKKTMHLLGWLGYFVILVLFFTSTSDFPTAFNRAIQTTIIHIALFYVNTEILMPKFLDKKQYTSYIIWLCCGIM